MLYLDSNCLEGMDKADHFLHHQLRYFYRKRYELINSLKPNSCHDTAHKEGQKWYQESSLFGCWFQDRWHKFLAPVGYLYFELCIPAVCRRALHRLSELVTPY